MRKTVLSFVLLFTAYCLRAQSEFTSNYTPVNTVPKESTVRMADNLYVEIGKQNVQQLKGLIPVWSIFKQPTEMSFKRKNNQRNGAVTDAKAYVQICTFNNKAYLLIYNFVRGCMCAALIGKGGEKIVIGNAPQTFVLTDFKNAYGYPSAQLTDQPCTVDPSAQYDKGWQAQLTLAVNDKMEIVTSAVLQSLTNYKRTIDRTGTDVHSVWTSLAQNTFPDEREKMSAEEIKRYADATKPVKPASARISKCLSGDCQNGTGEYREETVRSPYTYTGQFKEGRPNGKGKRTHEDGTIYEGEFTDGVLTKGSVLFSTGEYYKGIFQKATYLTQLIDGTAREKIGENMYEGSWKGGEMANGRITYKNGDVYEGATFRQDRHGKGKMNYKNGDQFSGEFDHGSLQGYGELMHEGKIVRKGYWYNNEYRPVSALTRQDLKTENGIALLLDEYLRNIINGSFAEYKGGSLEDFIVSERTAAGLPKTTKGIFEYTKRDRKFKGTITMTFNQNMLPILVNLETPTDIIGSGTEMLNDYLINKAAAGKILYTNDELASIPKLYYAAKKKEIQGNPDFQALVSQLKKYPASSDGCLSNTHIEGWGLGPVNKVQTIRGDFGQPEQVTVRDIDFVAKKVPAFENRCSKDIYIKGITCIKNEKTDKFLYYDATIVLKPGEVHIAVEIESKFSLFTEGTHYFYNF